MRRRGTVCCRGQRGSGTVFERSRACRQTERELQIDREQSLRFELFVYSAGALKATDSRRACLRAGGERYDPSGSPILENDEIDPWSSHFEIVSNQTGRPRAPRTFPVARGLIALSQFSFKTGRLSRLANGTGGNQLVACGRSRWLAYFRQTERIPFYVRPPDAISMPVGETTEKATGANGTLPGNEDQLTADVIFARASSQGLYNAAIESAFSRIFPVPSIPPGRMAR